jgi:hypothetical protein
MDVTEVIRRVAVVRSLAGDDETAHGAEDELWRGVLAAIANGECDDPEACAAEALKTSEIDFHRWCA